MRRTRRDGCHHAGRPGCRRLPLDGPWPGRQAADIQMV